MKISYEAHLKTIKTEFISGNTLEWDCGAWSRSGKPFNNEIFDCINDYWRNSDIRRLHDVERIMTTIHNTLMDMIPLTEKNEILKTLIFELFLLIDWNVFKYWCEVHGHLHFNSGNKTEVSAGDPDGMTYFPDDIIELVVFSVFIKNIMPVWGMYYYITESSIGSDAAFIAGVDLITNDYTNSNKAFLKLINYVEAFIASRIKVNTFAILKGMGSDEMPAYLVAMALWKKIVLYDGRIYAAHIVKNLYNVLDEKVSNAIAAVPTGKKDPDAGSDDISVIERYRINQRIPAGIHVLLEVASNDIVTIVQHSCHDISKAAIKKEMAIYPSLIKNWKVLPFHMSIIALVLDGNISVRSMELVNEVTMVNLSLASHIILKHRGLFGLAELLIGEWVPKEESDFSVAVSIAPLDTELSKELEIIYRYASPNLANNLINLIVVEQISRNWINGELMHDTKNETAKLILRKNA